MQDYILVDICKQIKRLADAFEESNKMIKDLSRLDVNDFKE